MKISLRKKIIVSCTVVVVLTGLITTWIGIHLIGSSIIREAQKKVAMDLNAARELYNKELDNIYQVIRLTAKRFFIQTDLLSENINDIAYKLEAVRQSEGLDILTLTDKNGTVIVRTRNPAVTGDSQNKDVLIRIVIKEKRSIGSTQLVSRNELEKEGKDLVDKAYIKIISTPKAVPTTKEYETAGMMLKVAAPILDSGGHLLGVLYGGNLINQNYKIVDKIADVVFKGEYYKGKYIGTATIFQGDLRISTNVKTTEGIRAVGTRVSEEVRRQVLEKAQPWIDRAFVVNNWYITAYEPITNCVNEVIGILYVGILEQKYVDLKTRTLLVFLGITGSGIIASLIVAFLLSNGIIRPVRQLVSASKQVARGNLDLQVPCTTGDELGELAGSFNAMASAIKERDEQLRMRAQEEIMKSERLAMIGQLAAGVAHEINNPLGSILLFSRLLLKSCPPEGTTRDNLERIEKEVKRCQNIVQGLLEFARKREPKIETIQVHELLDKTLALFENQPLFHNIEIKRNYQVPLPVVSADPAQIQQVFVNIIMNAVDAMHGEGKLTVSTRSHPEDTYLEISFSDTGCGIAPQMLDRIFEPFFTTKETGHGTGLGLSISYGIIQRHGGELKVSSEINKGSTFSVILPKEEDRV